MERASQGGCILSTSPLPTVTALVTKEELLARNISLFASVTIKTPSKTFSVGELISAIRAGRWREKVERLRQIYQTDGVAAYKEARKTDLESVTGSGVFRTCRDEALEKHSGLVVIDLDHLGDRLPAVRQQVIDTGLALCVFASPSGDGLKVLLPVEAHDGESHRAAYGAALERFKDLGVVADTSCRNPSRLCFVSYDPDIWVNPSPSLSLLSAPTPTIYTLPSTPYTLHSALQEQGGLTAGPALRIKQLKQLERDDPVMADLFSKHVMRRMNAEAGKRNEALAASVPYLFRAVSGEVAEKLVALALKMNAEVYHGTMEEHLASFKGLWDGCAEHYSSELSRPELEAYTALDRGERAAFRIMRDLAVASNGQFYMSCDQLQHRLGNGCNGWRLLNRFSAGGYGIIAQVKAGTRREKGVTGRAAYWRWVLPLPPAGGLVGAVAA